LNILQENIYRECNFKFRDVILDPTVARGTGTCITTLPPLKKKLIGFEQIRWVSLGEVRGQVPPFAPLGYATASRTLSSVTYFMDDGPFATPSLPLPTN